MESMGRVCKIAQRPRRHTMQLDQVLVYVLQDRTRLLDALASIVVLLLLVVVTPLFLWRGCTFRRNVVGSREVRARILKTAARTRSTLTTETCANGRGLRVRSKGDEAGEASLDIRMCTDDALMIYYVGMQCPTIVDGKGTTFTIRVKNQESLYALKTDATPCSVAVRRDTSRESWRRNVARLSSLVPALRKTAAPDAESESLPVVALVYSIYGTRIQWIDDNRPSTWSRVLRAVRLSR